MKEYQRVSKWFIGLSVLYVITGLVMCIWPNLTTDLLGIVLGIGMLVVGIAHIILYFTKEHLEGILQMDLTIGVILGAFGAFMLMHRDFVGMAIPFGIGILLLIGGISKIQYALDMKRLHFLHWKVMLAVSIVLMAAGLVLIYNPFAEKILIYFIAGCLIADGIASIIGVLMISHRMKNLAKGWVPKHMRPGKTVPAAPNGAFVPAAPPVEEGAFVPAPAPESVPQEAAPAPMNPQPEVIDASEPAKNE